MDLIQEAINTPKELRTKQQKALIFGDCNPNLKIETYRLRSNELVRRLDAGEYLTKADKKEAKKLKKEGIY